MSSIETKDLEQRVTELEGAFHELATKILSILNEVSEHQTEQLAQLQKANLAIIARIFGKPSIEN